MTLRADLAIRDAPLPRPIVSARGTWTSRRGVVLVARDPEGKIGQGEATPLPGYSPDDADACAHALEDACRRLDAYAEALPPEVEASLASLPAARFALETALADLAAQRRGTSVASYLAGVPVNRTIPRAGLLDLGSVTLEDDARALVARGIVTVKAKIGARPLADDLARLGRLRGAIGPSIALRLDANGALGASGRDGARAALEQLACVLPEIVEEPAASGAALVSLGRCAVPWAADESLQDARIAEHLLGAPCAAFVVKPALHGLRGARVLALRAQAAGKAVIVTHLFDGPVALAAACELALSLPAAFGPACACGLDVHPGLAVFGPMRILQLETPGWITPHTGVGLGLSSPGVA